MSTPTATPSTTQVRRSLGGLRRGRPSTETGARSTSDPDVLSLVTDPFESVADAHRRLSALEALFFERGDRRGPFLVVYSRVTAAVGEAIEAGEFVDPDWVDSYLVTFADLYREALFRFETGDLDAVPDPWQVAFESAARGDCLVAQDAVLGINAHVNYDLALALSRIGIDPDREEKYEDHCAVNDVLRRLVDEVQAALASRYAPGLTEVDDSLGRLDEALSVLALAEGRDSAWRVAVALADSRTGIRERAAMWFLRTSSTGAAYFLLSPTVSRRLGDSLRRLETAEQPPTR